MKVVIVESPAKAKTINKYLGKDYGVYASFGHVRDLAAKDGSVDPDDDFAMRWEVDAKAAKRLSDIGVAVKGADRVILGDRPRSRGRGDLLARPRDPQEQEAPEGQARRPGGVQRRHQGRGPGGHAPSARDRRGAGRRLSRAPRARLSRRLHPLAGAVAQAPRRALGRAASSRSRLRIVCDRELEIEQFVAREYWSIVAHLETEAERALHRAARRRRRQEDQPARHRLGRRGAKPSRRRSRRRSSRSRRSNRSRSSATPTRPSPPRPCSRRPRASSASRRRAPCRSPSASMKASTSATARSASSPICAPTASTSRPRRSRPRAASSPRISATTTCRARRANTPSRPRTRRKRTRRSGRPT